MTMFATIILTLAMTGQSPRNEIADLMPDRPTQARRIQGRKAALYRQARAREYREYRAEQEAREAERKQFEKELPFRLELQRQALQRQSDIERNEALHRLAAAAEQEAINQQYLMWQLRRGVR